MRRVRLRHHMSSCIVSHGPQQFRLGSLGLYWSETFFSLALSPESFIGRNRLWCAPSRAANPPSLLGTGLFFFSFFFFKKIGTLEIFVFCIPEKLSSSYLVGTLTLLCLITAGGLGGFR